MIAAPLIVLLVIAVLGHVMALIWYLAVTPLEDQRGGSTTCRSDAQISRELRNSLHAPIHAVILAAFLLLGFFTNTSVGSFFDTALLTTVWAEDLALRVAPRLPSQAPALDPRRAPQEPPEQLADRDLVLVHGKAHLRHRPARHLAMVDYFVSLNFYGIAAWYIGYLVINSFSHANFELTKDYNRGWARC